MVFWITGLSGAGKSTLARTWFEHLRNQGILPFLIDGDEMREVIRDLQVGHDRLSRIQHAHRICRLARLAERQGHLVIVATMSLFHEIHQWNRQNFEDYLEIWLKVDSEVLRRRHPKGLYNGGHTNVVGLDLPAEEPQQPHLVLSNNSERPDLMDFVEQIESLWKQRSAVR